MLGRSQLLRRISASSTISIVLAVAVLATAVPVALSARATVDRRNDVWEPAVAAAGDALAGALDQEAAVRGFAVSGDEAFLDEYQTASDTTAAAFRTITALPVGDRVAQQLEQTRAALERWRSDEAEAAIAAVEAGEQRRAAGIVAAGAGTGPFEVFRDEHRALMAELRAREADAARAVRQSVRWLLLILASGTALILALSLLVRRWVTRSVEQYGETVSEVEQRERRFRTLVEASSSLVWDSDARGAFVQPQPAWAAYTGQQWPDHAGVGWSEMVHPDDRSRLLHAWRDAATHPAVFEVDGRLWHAASKAYRRFTMRAAPILDSSGVVEWIGTMTDVEDARRAHDRELEALARLRESEERHRALVESSVAVRWTTDAEGRFVEPQDEWRRYTSQPWEQHEGFGWAEMVHPDDRATVLAAWRAAVADASDYRTTARVWHAATTTYRWVEARAVPRFDDGGEVIEWAGTITDVHERRVAERRLSAMAALTSGLATASTTDDVLDTTIAVLCEHLDAPMLGIGLADEEQFHILRAAGAPPDFEPDIHVPLDTLAPAVDAIRMRDVLSLTERERTVWYPGETVWAALGLQSAAYVPIVANGAGIGVIVLGYTSVRRVEHDEKAMLATMGELVGQALTRARLFEFERSIATVLQDSMLPVDPIVAGDVNIASRYVPAIAALDVGGDWYDVIALGERIGLAVGDVVGRGIRAAAVMGQLRSALGAIALTTARPGAVLTLLDRFARHIDGAAVTTCLYLVLDPESNTVHHSSAGHPPPLVVDPDGDVRFLGGGLGPPLAATPDVADRPEQGSRLVPGSTILLYTDGLVERRGENLDDGFGRLADAVARHRELPVEQLCDAVLEEMLEGQDRRDDVALVALRTPGAGSRGFVRHVVTDPRHLAAIRHDLDAWLVEQGVAGRDERADIVLAACEAVANSMEHAYGPSPHHLVGIEASLRDGELWVTVRDAGRWRPPRHDPTRGRGFEVMRALMDSVDVDPSPRGTTVTLRRLLGSPTSAPAANGTATADPVPTG